MTTSSIGFWRIAAEEPDRVALIDAQGGMVSFAQLRASSNQLVHALRGIGLRPGDALACVLPNGRAFFDAYLATTQAGFYLTPINFHLNSSELSYIVRDSDAKALLVSERFAETARSAATELDLPPHQLLAVGHIDGFTDLDELVASFPDHDPSDRRAGQPMRYTSGTTGRPKGVRPPLLDADPDVVAEAMAQILIEAFDWMPEPATNLCTVPLYHIGGSGPATGALHLGQTVVLMDKWDAETTLALIDRHRVTTSYMVPTMFHRLLALPDVVKACYNTTSLRSVIHGAAPCPVETKRRMMEWWGPVLYEAYAATEGGSGTAVRPEEWLEHPGTVGRPIAGAAVKIIDDNGEECRPGVPGTIYLQSPGGGGASGTFEYYKDPEKTRASRREGMFTVGDIGYVTDDGYLFLSDRKSDVIISGGVNIYPAEIEAVLLEHPKVDDAAVIGIPNPEWGEEVKAVVQPATGFPPNDQLADELIAHCHERLARYKCPRSVDFRSALPRLEAGKLSRRTLRDGYWKDSGRAI